jgi:hypothetical protein
MARRLKETGLPYELDEEALMDLVGSPCAFCGDSLGLGRSEPILKVAELGYVPGNCVPGCPQCKRAKSGKDMREFFGWLRAIAARVG